jgi:O-antigen/teichoic acid export membrane protein
MPVAGQTPSAPPADDRVDMGGMSIRHVRKAAMSSAMWIMVGFLAMYLLRIASSMILTRLLHPQIYGLMDLVMVFIQGLHMFSDVGITPCIVQSSRGEDRNFLNTAWTFQLIRGAVLWAASALIAWPVAVLYGKPVLALLLPVVGVTALIEGANSTAICLLNRHLNRGKLVALDLTNAVINIVVTIACVWLMYPSMFGEVLAGQRESLWPEQWHSWALVTGGMGIEAVREEWEAMLPDQPLVWAVVFGNIASIVAFMVLSHLILPGFRNRLCWEPAARTELLGFGKWVFISSIFTFLGYQSDRMILPAITDFATLGLYGRAMSLAMIAGGLMGAFASQLVFPVYSRFQQMGRDLRLAFRQVHVGAASFAALLVTGMVCSGPAAAKVLFPENYWDAAWILQFLAIGMWFQMLAATIEASLLALGKVRSLMVVNAAKVIALMILMPLGWHLGSQTTFGGLIGLILGVVASDFFRYLMTIWIARQNGLSAWGYDVILSVVIVLFSGAAWWLGNSAAELILGYPPETRWHRLLLFVCQGVSAVLLWGLVFVGLWRTGRLKLRRIGVTEEEAS